MHLLHMSFSIGISANLLAMALSLERSVDMQMTAYRVAGFEGSVCKLRWQFFFFFLEASENGFNCPPIKSKLGLLC